MSNQRAPDGSTTVGLRPLGLPRPVRVRTDEYGEPSTLTLLPRGAPALVAGRRWRDAHTLAVERVEEVWRIAEEWWREAPLARTYYRVTLEDGRSLTVFEDGGDGRWYEQRY